MQITIQYESQARRAAGVSSETIEVPDGCRSICDCIRTVAAAHGEELKPILVNADGEVQPTLLVFLNDSQIVRGTESMLSDGDTLTLMTPLSGG
jgi:molybdopterin converting factor small subunit